MHGSPADEDEYLVHAGDVEPLLDWLDAPLTFFGHTHVQGGFLLARGGVRRYPSGMEPILQLEPDHYYLVNPGSVGQPRDMTRARPTRIYSPEDRTVEFRRVAYNVGARGGQDSGRRIAALPRRASPRRDVAL